MTSYPIEVDWRAVIANLRKECKNYDGIALASGVSKTNISYMGAGNVKNPGYSNAAKLLNCYINKFGEKIPLITIR